MLQAGLRGKTGRETVSLMDLTKYSAIHRIQQYKWSVTRQLQHALKHAWLDDTFYSKWNNVLFSRRLDTQDCDHKLIKKLRTKLINQARIFSLTYVQLFFRFFLDLDSAV